MHIIMRPWGSEEILQHQYGYKVKQITVNAGCRTSLQRHISRNEYWMIIQGDAFVTIGENSNNYLRGMHLYIPKGVVHRVENAGNQAMKFIEIQSGSYLGDDDIIRIDDDYGRVDK